MKKFFVLTSILTVGLAPLQAAQVVKSDAHNRSSWSSAQWVLAGALSAGAGYLAYKYCGSYTQPTNPQRPFPSTTSTSIQPQSSHNPSPLVPMTPNATQASVQSIPVSSATQLSQLTSPPSLQTLTPVISQPSPKSPIQVHVDRYTHLFTTEYTDERLQHLNEDAQKHAKWRVQSVVGVEFPNHQISLEIKKILDEHAGDMGKHFAIGASFRTHSHVHIFPWLKDYVIKAPLLDGENRIEGSEWCKYIIKQASPHLNLLRVPDKYHYRNPITQQSYVVVPVVEGAYKLNSKQEPRTLNLAQTMQLACFMRMSGAWDMRRSNVAVGDMVDLIDTEKSTFGIQADKFSLHGGIDYYKSVMGCLVTLLRGGGLDDDARQFVETIIRNENKKKSEWDSKRMTDQELSDCFAECKKERL